MTDSTGLLSWRGQGSVVSHWMTREHVLLTFTS
jgi:hypothetical protein